MKRDRRPSEQTVAVLRSWAGAAADWRYGYDLCLELGLKAGTLYPILMRLADRGLLETAWEVEPAPGRPPRHLYRLTGEGVATVRRWNAEEATSRPGRTTFRFQQKARHES